VSDSGRPHLAQRLAPSWPSFIGVVFLLLFLGTAIDGYVLPRVAVLLSGGAVGLALCLLVTRTSLRATLGPLAWPALAVVAAVLLALAFSISPWASLAGHYLRYESAPVRIGYLLLFATAAGLLAAGGEAARRRAVGWFLLGCCVVALEAGWEWIANRYGLAGALDRPDGNLGNAALLGVVMAMAVPLAIGRLLAPRGLRWTPVLGLVLLGLVLSSERSAWLGALLATLLVLGVRLPRRWLGWGAAAAILILAAAVLVIVAGPLSGLNGDPFTLRLELWRRVLPMLAARPWSGWGEDTFGLVFGRYSGGFLPGLVFDRAHSQPLDLAAAQGIAGVAALAWFWVAFGLDFLRSGRWRQEENSALLAGLAGYSAWSLVNFDWAPATGLCWLLAAVAWSAGRRPAPAPSPGPNLLLSAGATLVTAAAAVAFGILPVGADLAAYRGDPQQAVALDPIQSHYHQLLGERLLADGRIQAAAAELRRAGELGDDAATDYVELGRAELRLGDKAAAAAAYARAHQLDPNLKTP
jgi:MFS family permease